MSSIDHIGAYSITHMLSCEQCIRKQWEGGCVKNEIGLQHNTHKYRVQRQQISAALSSTQVFGDVRADRLGDCVCLCESLCPR